MVSYFILSIFHPNGDFGAKKTVFLLNKLKKKLFQKNKVVLDILETRLVSKFDMIRLKIMPFSKEKRYF